MIFLTGNLLDIEQGMIAHQVNCYRVAKAGLAKQIGERWPAWDRSFVQAHPAPGHARYFYVSHLVVIADLYAQDDYGTGRRYTRYGWLATALSEARSQAEGLGLKLYLPFGIGCGLGGGDWRTVLSIIEDCAPSTILVKRAA